MQLESILDFVCKNSPETDFITTYIPRSIFQDIKERLDKDYYNTYKSLFDMGSFLYRNKEFSYIVVDRDRDYIKFMANQAILGYRDGTTRII